jgi:uncharacterized protein (DUF1810 family)
VHNPVHNLRPVTQKSRSPNRLHQCDELLTTRGHQRKLPVHMITPDPHNLRRYLDAQNSIYPQVVAELRSGRKETHWMWFIFPQVKGLGTSPTAQMYAISSLDEAKAYLNHPVLGIRLRECTQLVTAVNGRSIEDIFGYPDHLKFHSSMTLFAHADDDNQVFTGALKKYFHSKFDGQTIQRL